MIMETFAILDIYTKEKYIYTDIGISPVSCANSGTIKPKRKERFFQMNNKDDNRKLVDFVRQHDDQELDVTLLTDGIVLASSRGAGSDRIGFSTAQYLQRRQRRCICHPHRDFGSIDLDGFKQEEGAERLVSQNNGMVPLMEIVDFLLERVGDDRVEQPDTRTAKLGLSMR